MSNPIGTTYRNNNEFSVRDTGIKDEKTEIIRDKEQSIFRGLNVAISESEKEIKKLIKKPTETETQEIKNRLDQLEKHSELKSRCIRIKLIANCLMSIEQQKIESDRETFSDEQKEEINLCKMTLKNLYRKDLDYEDIGSNEKKRIDQLIFETALSIKLNLMPYNEAEEIKKHIDLINGKAITKTTKFANNLKGLSDINIKRDKDTLELAKEINSLKTEDAFFKATDMIKAKLEYMESKGKPEPDIDKC